MRAEQEICFSDESENLSENFENDFDNEGILEDKWIFPKASDHLGTILRAGVVRPLSPTLKVHSPESVFPGVAMLYEGFDDMREWKNTIEFVRFFAQKGKMFNSRHHWDMRTKFLEVRLRCLEKIVEDPCGVHRKPVGGFFVRAPLTVQKTLEDERKKTELARGRENTVRKEHVMDEAYVGQQNFAKKELPDNIVGKRCVKEQINAQKQTGIKEESNVDIKNCPTHRMLKHGDNVGNNNSINVEFSSVRKDSTSINNTRMKSKGDQKKIDIWIPNPNNCVGDSSMYMLESCNLNNEHALSTNAPETTLAMLREQRRLRKENDRENIGSSEDEKLKRESLEKGLNLESRRETSGTRAECGHFPTSNDNVQDLKVIGKSVASFTREFVDNHSSNSNKDNESVNIKKGLSSNSETLSCKVEEEMVLEDISDKDFVSNLILPSSCKFEHTAVEDVQTATARKVSTTEACGNLVKQNTAERPKQRILSRLRRRIRHLFSCFTRNQVTPVDI
jgi:hypothetical protein